MDHNPYLTLGGGPNPARPPARGDLSAPRRCRISSGRRAPPRPPPMRKRWPTISSPVSLPGWEELGASVAALNARGSRSPSGAEWTEASFTAEMQRLGW